MSNQKLFEPLQLGEIELKNRIIMAPMTRSRAEHENHLPVEIMQTYYQQRAEAGLIITEGVIISEIGNGYIHIPGIYNEKQIAEWKKITDKVHQNGGKIFAQLWHVGRISHPDLIGGKKPLSASAINPDYYAFTFEGKKDTVTPKEMTLDDIKDTVQDFRKAAINAIMAGFDGVELHGANAYLIHQFITSGGNQRTDDYGGSVEKRGRFIFEVLDAVTDAVGSERVGIRLSPIDHGVAGVILDDLTKETFDYIIKKLNDYNLAYLHLTSALMADAGGNVPNAPIIAATKAYRNIYKGNIIINKSFDKLSAEKVIADGIADAVAFGVPFIANPDLVKRLREELPLNSPDADTFFQGGEKGYIDYPASNLKTV